jgi:hypothetical protein
MLLVERIFTFKSVKCGKIPPMLVAEIPEQQVAKLLYAANEMRIACFIWNNMAPL